MNYDIPLDDLGCLHAARSSVEVPSQESPYIGAGRVVITTYHCALKRLMKRVVSVADKLIYFHVLGLSTVIKSRAIEELHTL